MKIKYVSRTEYQKQWATNNRDAIIKSKKKYNLKNKDKINEINKLRKTHQRLDVLKHYSDGKLECKCCGESEYQFLTIDHVNGGGYKHKKETHGHVCLWLILNNFPEGYQVLCYNCNCGRAKNGGVCPHKDSC